MRAYLFGAFNPPTNAHIAMGLAAQQALNEKPWNIVYVPSGESYIRSWKGYDSDNMFPPKDRYELLKTAVSSYEFGVAKVETLGITTKTYDTLEYLGFDDAVLCLGTDNVAQMKKWYRYEELLPKITLMVFDRSECRPFDDLDVKEIMSMAKSCITVELSCDYVGISSSLVRESMADGDLGMVERLVPENVYEYLIGYYGKAKG